MVDPVKHLNFHDSDSYTLKPFKLYSANVEILDEWEPIIFETFSQTKSAIHITNIGDNSIDYELYGTILPDIPGHDSENLLRDNWHKITLPTNSTEGVIAAHDDTFLTVSDPYSHILLRMKRTANGADTDAILRVRQQVES